MCPTQACAERTFRAERFLKARSWLDYATEFEKDNKRCDLLRSIIREHYYGTADQRWLRTDSAQSAINYEGVIRYTNACRWVLPWVHRCCNLSGARIIDIGAGTGATTVAFAHLAAFVSGYEIEEKSVAAANKRFAAMGVENCCIHLVSPEDQLDVVKRKHPDGSDFVLLFAVLEHLTQEERIIYLSTIWHEILRPGGYLVVVDTPNRLAYFDAHTSEMPFFHILPPHLALNYFCRSPRAEFVSGMREVIQAREDAVIALHRWGLGASFHEFEIAFGVESLEGLIVANGFEWEMTNWFPPKLEDKLLVTYFVEKELTQDVGFSRSVLNFIFKKPDGGLAIARPLINKEYLSMLIQSFGLDPRLLQRFGLSDGVQFKASEPMMASETGPADGSKRDAKEFWAMKTSTSWRMNAPLRFIAERTPGLRRIVRGLARS